MGQPVGIVVVLIGIEIFVRVAGEDLTRDELRAVSQKHRIGFDDLNSITTEDSFPRQARILRQTNLDAVPTGSADHGVRDAGVPAGRVDDRHSGFEFATAFAFQNHRQRRAILDRSTGIEMLCLGKDLNARAQLSVEKSQSQEWRVSDVCFNRAGLNADAVSV